mmetsp:Transcript_20301/g.50478  ORF Transcript_20301/g.50478 Transcript_20301/m.50478 type:complete len:262 (+) Transcript_20301:2876-3661(+)
MPVRRVVLNEVDFDPGWSARVFRDFIIGSAMHPTIIDILLGTNREPFVRVGRTIVKDDHHLYAQAFLCGRMHSNVEAKGIHSALFDTSHRQVVFGRCPCNIPLLQCIIVIRFTVDSLGFYRKNPIFRACRIREWKQSRVFGVPIGNQFRTILGRRDFRSRKGGLREPEYSDIIECNFHPCFGAFPKQASIDCGRSIGRLVIKGSKGCEVKPLPVIVLGCAPPIVPFLSPITVVHEGRNLETVGTKLVTVGKAAGFGEAGLG